MYLYEINVPLYLYTDMCFPGCLQVPESGEQFTLIIQSDDSGIDFASPTEATITVEPRGHSVFQIAASDRLVINQCSALYLSLLEYVCSENAFSCCSWQQEEGSNHLWGPDCDSREGGWSAVDC